MSEKENKFILGDNTSGYRRSADSEKTQPIALPSRQPVRRQAKPPVRPSQRQPVKSRPTLNEQRKSPAQRPARSGQAPVRRPSAQPQQDDALSQNERRKLHNEQRRRQRRRKQLLNYAAVCAVVLVVAVVLSLTVFFKISEITVSGKSPYTDEQIIEASGIALGENVIRCDTDSVSGSLAKKLPYIGSAEVKRSLSGKVTITVETTAPMWSVINGETAMLIDSQGKLLEIGAPEIALEATIIQGVTVSTAVLGETVEFSDDVPFSFVKEIGDAMQAAGLDKITTLNLIDVDYIQALYDGRLTIIIGTVDNLDKKLALTAKVIERENEIDPGQYGTIDLTIDDKLYFRPEEPEEEV